MSKDHGSKGHGNHKQYEHEKAKERALHKDWRTWLVVLIMLGGMGLYLVSMDEALSPIREPGPKGPAAAETPMPADAPAAP